MSFLPRTAVLLILLAPLAGWADSPRRLPPVAIPLEVASYESWADYTCGPLEPPDYEVGAQFNRGVFIRSTNLEERPYSMYIGGRLQLRYLGFMRDSETWTDNAGVTRDIRNRNQFDTERVRLNISGVALSPRLSYNFIFDADGDGGALTDGLAYYFDYQFDDALRVRMGRWKAAAHREWLLSSRYFRMADRSLATEHFRVGFTDGLWLLGDFELLGVERWHYETSLTNGLRTSARNATLLDDNLAACATLYCDPLGAYEQGVADYAWHESPVVRVGGSFAFSKSDDRSDVGLSLGDDNFLRLSDGTRLADPGALAPGVSVMGVRTLLASFDLGVKYRGWSASAEYFIRSLQDFTADGALPVGKLYDYGYHAEIGTFLIEKRLDVNFRVSQISGLFGDSYEYTAGWNWYWGDGQDDRVNKLTFDVSHVQRSPVNSSIIDILAGDDGTLFRAQAQIGF